MSEFPLKDTEFHFYDEFVDKEKYGSAYIREYRNSRYSLHAMFFNQTKEDYEKAKAAHNVAALDPAIDLLTHTHINYPVADVITSDNDPFMGLAFRLGDAFEDVKDSRNIANDKDPDYRFLYESLLQADPVLRKEFPGFHIFPTKEELAAYDVEMTKEEEEEDEEE